MFNRSPMWKTVAIAVTAAVLFISGLLVVVYFAVARDRIASPAPTPAGTATLQPTSTPTPAPVAELPETPTPPDAALGVVQEYTPGALIIVITPIEGTVEQIIVPENLEVSWQDGRRASPREIARGQTIYAEGSLDGLGRLIARAIVIIDPGAAATATPLVSPTPEATPTPEIPYRAWLGQYYANMTLSGSPVMVRVDQDIDFNWGTGSPGANVPADRFSVRWRGRWPFGTGVYTFVAHSDDGVRIWVDGQLVIDRWVDQSGATAAGEIYLQNGDHLVEVEYYENLERAEIRVFWERQGTFANWKGEYFDNPDLQGEPVLVRNDVEINFDWGSGSPHPNVPADNFSARWSQDVSFDGGAYRFRARADDGVRVWVDDVLVIDAWRPNVEQTFTGFLYLPKGSHPVRIEYFELAGNASIQVWHDQITSFANWRGEYYANPDLSGVPRFVRDDEKIHFDWGMGSPGFGLPNDNFSIRWTRRLPLEAGRYNFWAIADDGVRVYVDGRLVIDAWRDSGAERYDGSIDLDSGEHRIVVDYYERVGTALIQFGWEWVPPATPTPTATATATATAQPTATSTPTAPPPAATATPTATVTVTPTPTATPT